MAFNALKKWIGTQLWSTFMSEYNANIDELNRVIPEIETNIGLLPEYSSNANGEMWKFPNGLMICANTVTLTYQSEATLSVGATFPQAFAGTPPKVSIGMLRIHGGTDVGVTVIRKTSNIYVYWTSTSSVTIFCTNETESSFNAGEIMFCSYIAIGKWK